MATKPLTQTTGRRKEAVARARLRPGTGQITINGAAFEDYFPTATQRMVVTEPLRVTETDEAYDVDATSTAAGSAARPARCAWPSPARSIELDPELRPALKKAGLLTRDPRARRARSTASRRPARRRSTPSAERSGAPCR